MFSTLAAAVTHSSNYSYHMYPRTIAALLLIYTGFIFYSTPTIVVYH